MSMTKQSLAAMLDGRSEGDEITDFEALGAKAAGLVVVFGYSDDNTEFKGAINDEVGCYGGHKFKVTADGVLEPWDRGEEKDKLAATEWFEKSQLPSATLKAKWCESKASCWTYDLDIPHATFRVMSTDEEGAVFCVGIVFSLSDLKEVSK